MDRRLAIFAVLLVINGGVNSLFTRWLYTTKACGVYCDGKEPKYRTFGHPFVLSLIRSLGRIVFLIIYFIVHLVRSLASTNQQSAPEPLLPACQWFSMMPASLASVMGISTNFLGVRLAPNGEFQLLRGTAVIFTGLLSVVFLSQLIRRHQWFGIIVVSLGAALIGSVSIIFYGDQTNTQRNASSIVAGSLLIILGEIISATQQVLEQRYIRMYNINTLLAVGLEGLFGSIFIGAMLYPMYHIRINFPLTSDPEGRLEDVLDALAMMREERVILWSLLGMTLGGATFTYIGMVILKEHSAVTRAVLNCGQVSVTFILNIILGWSPNKLEALALQIPGFLMNSLIGPFLFFGVVLAPLWQKCRTPRQRIPTVGLQEDGEEVCDSMEESDILYSAEVNQAYDTDPESTINERRRLLSNSNISYST